MGRKVVNRSGYVAKTLETDVYTETKNRIRWAFEYFDHVIVAFSGGKDSTVVLFMALEIAREYGKLPLTTVLFDEEIIDPDTFEFDKQIYQIPDLDFHWLCLPTRHTITSTTRSCWWCWDPDLGPKNWIRPMPEWAISDVPGYPRKWPAEEKSNGLSDGIKFRLNHLEGSVMKLTGIRTEESFNRRRAVMGSGDWWYWEYGKQWAYGKPIYDWTWEDIWRAIAINNWPYTAFYDKMQMRGVAPHNQRVAPWGNSNQSGDVRFWPEFYPDFWAKAIDRLPELKAMSRYGKSKMYRGTTRKPTGMSWQDFTFHLIDKLPTESDKKYWTNHVKRALRKYAKVYSTPFPEEPIMIENYGKEPMQCWKRLATIIAKNDRTGRDQT